MKANLPDKENGRPKRRRRRGRQNCDPDAGLALRPEVRARLEVALRSTKADKRGTPLEEVARKLGLQLRGAGQLPEELLPAEKTLWILNHYAVTPDLPGRTRHFDLGRELIRQGWRVILFASSFQHHDHREAKLSGGERWRLEEVERVSIVWVRTTPYVRNDWRRALNMVSFAVRAWGIGRSLPRRETRVRRPDVVIGSSVHLLTVLAAWRLARRHRARFIMEVRDLWPETLIDMREVKKHSLVARLLRVLERFLYRRADRIITLLPRAHEYIESRGIPGRKIVWIPNGVDVTRFEPVPARRTTGSLFTVMYLGAHGQANTLDVVLEAAKLLQDQAKERVRFILVGDGPEKPRLMEEAGRFSLSNVEFRNALPKDDVPKTLAEADATVLVLHDLPLYRYGISLNKLFDYLAAARPIILAGNPANNPVAEAMCGLVVPPQDPLALTKAVIALLETPASERAAMGARGRAYVEERHALPALARRLAECLEEGA